MGIVVKKQKEFEERVELLRNIFFLNDKILPVDRKTIWGQTTIVSEKMLNLVLIIDRKRGFESIGSIDGDEKKFVLWRPVFLDNEQFIAFDRLYSLNDFNENFTKLNEMSKNCNKRNNYDSFTMILEDFYKYSITNFLEGKVTQENIEFYINEDLKKIESYRKNVVELFNKSISELGIADLFEIFIQECLKNEILERREIFYFKPN